MRLLLLVLLIVLVAVLVKRWLSRPGPASSSTPSPVIQDMVGCAHCQLCLPAEDAVRWQGLHFCCPDHLNQHRQNLQ